MIMKNRLFNHLALRNLKANKLLEIPFVLAVSLMTSLLFIMVSLKDNDFVINTANLGFFIDFGIIIIGVFSFVFVIYANNYVIKKRKKEFALYKVMGLGNRNISAIVFFENLYKFLIIFCLSILGGYLLGKIMFLLLNYLIHNSQVSIMNYGFSFKALAFVSKFLGGCFLVIVIISLKGLTKLNPIQLLYAQRVGEQAPYIKWPLLVIGLFSLAIGYYLALTTEGILASLNKFMIAIIAVMIGTYCLFVALSIFVLKMLQKRPKYYYRDKHFLTISGMLYRMKANAVGIASISILATAIIITLATTLTIYNGIEKAINSRMSMQYLITTDERYALSDEEKIANAKTEMLNKIMATISSTNKVTDYQIDASIMLTAIADGATLEKLANINQQGNCYLVIMTLEDYNVGRQQPLLLNNQEIYMTANTASFKKNNHLILANENYQVIPLADQVASNIAVDSYKIIVKDYQTLKKIVDYYALFEGANNLPISISWNVEQNDANYQKILTDKFSNSEYQLISKSDVRMDFYQLYGGFLFLGIIVGFIFLVGTVLVIYFKQVSEGVEDRENYQIMKKVGLSAKLIKKTADVQIIWLFVLPLIVAFVHTLFAFKIVANLLLMFGIQDKLLFFKNILIIMLLFGIVYLLIYQITSRIYYRIVNEG